MIFRSFVESRRHRRVAQTLYISVVEAARQPAWFTRLAVPDTLDGRFDLILLHAFALMHRLKAESGAQAAAARGVSQALFDLMFADMDQNLRELGVSDMSVGKRVKHMVKAFYGRAAAYEAGLAAPAPAALEEALARNLYGTHDGPVPPAVLTEVAGHLRRLVADLAASPIDGILDGAVSFAPLEGGS
jgi:cytochrome b pre-mRNA-processing protein 3